MRSDYVLYGIAIIFFIISGAVAVAQMSGFLLLDTMSVVVPLLFLLLGIVSAAVGYSAKPKTMMPQPQAPSSPTIPTQVASEVEEKPAPAGPAEEEMSLPPPSPPPVEEVKPVPEPEPGLGPEPEPPEPAEPSPPEVTVASIPSGEVEPPVAAAEETAEEEKPKPARRRRKKASN